VSPKRITRKQVLACVAKWRAVLHLEDWAIEVHVQKLNRPEDGVAHNQAQHEYRQAILRFDPNHITPDQLEATVIHELLHCHVWPLAHVAETLAAGNKKHREWSRVEEESLTTRLERVMLTITQPPVP
jgi:hypothetical protein